jgi:hypothetical protein
MNALLESIEVDIKCQEWNDRVASRTFVPWTSTYGSRSADILNRSEVSLRLFDRCAVPELCKAFRTGSIDSHAPTQFVLVCSYFLTCSSRLQLGGQGQPVWTGLVGSSAFQLQAQRCFYRYRCK